MKKLFRFLLVGLIIIIIAGVVYTVIPKYQIHSVRIDKDYVMIIKVNTLTGEITNYQERYTPKPKIQRIKLID